MFIRQTPSSTKKKESLMNTRKLYHWLKATTRKWKGLTRHQQANIQRFSRAVVCAESCHERKLASSVGSKPNSQRRKLQRFLGSKVVMKGFFQQWTQAVVERFGLSNLTLVVDETKIDDRIGVMVVGAVYEGRCIPLAWRSY